MVLGLMQNPTRLKGLSDDRAEYSAEELGESFGVLRDCRGRNDKCSEVLNALSEFASLGGVGGRAGNEA